MANLQMKKVEYQGTGDFNFENAGSVASNYKGMSLRFTKKNLASDKRVTLIAKDKTGEEFLLPCSEPLSGIIRKALSGGKSQRELLAVITKLDVYVREDGRYFVFQPEGDAAEEFAVDDLKKASVSYDEMLEW